MGSWHCIVTVQTRCVFWNYPFCPHKTTYSCFVTTVLGELWWNFFFYYVHLDFRDPKVRWDKRKHFSALLMSCICVWFCLRREEHLCSRMMSVYKYSWNTLRNWRCHQHLDVWRTTKLSLWSEMFSTWKRL